MTPNDPRHGTSAGYDAHRRNGEKACDPCRDAACRYEKGARFDRLRGRPRTLPAVGTARRLQAPGAMGYTLGEIAAECDTSWDMVQKWIHRDGIVRRDTADYVQRVFARLCMTPPPETTGKEKWRRSYARTVARKNGWLPPLAWDDIDRDPEPPTHDVPDVDIDEAVVHRVLAGERLPANTAERAEIVRRWLDTGRPLVSLEQLTGWNGQREKDRAMRTAS